MTHRPRAAAILPLVLVALLALPEEAEPQTTLIVDTQWIKSNPVLDFGILETAEPDHPSWTYTSQAWDGGTAGASGCPIPNWAPGYWSYIDHLGDCNSPATHQWFRTLLPVPRLDFVDKIELIALRRPGDRTGGNHDRIGVNDNLYVWVNPSTHSLDEIVGYGGTSDWVATLPFPTQLTDRLDSSPLHGEGLACGGPDGVPETAFSIEALPLPLEMFATGLNVVDLLLEEFCIDGGLSHVAFRLQLSPNSRKR